MKIINAKKAERKEVAGTILADQIRATFTIDEEMRLINRGINNPTDAEYLEYREKIGDLLDDYRSKWK